MIDVLGIGENGWQALDARSRELVVEARLVVGGRRHLAMLPDVDGQERRPWPSPLRDGLRSVVGGFHTGTVVLASGDPLLSGIANTLIDEFGAGRVRVHPSVSSETLARARMGWSSESVDVVTLVGRSTERFVPLLAPGAHLVLLCSNGDGPAQIARLATAHGAGSARLTAWWHLGGAAEGSRTSPCATWGDERTPDLVVVCLDVSQVERDPHHLGPAPGRRDDAFEHDGLITKRHVRAAALAHLRPMPGAVLWDLGAGSGAVGIEWALAAPRTRVIAVERDPARAERIRGNAERHGVGDRVDVVTGPTREALEDLDLDAPDAVFLGGGIERSVLDAALARLRLGGRLVAHAVTAESEVILLDAQREHGGDMARIAIEHLEPLGRFRGWKPARGVVQLSITRDWSVPEKTKEHA